MQYVITLIENKYIHIQMHSQYAFGVILNTLNGVCEET